MTYQETLDYLYRTLPIFQRVGAAAYKANLDNTIALCAELGNPQSQFKSVHVAGTNGKGSSSHMIAAILQSAGYKTGLYTSPHLKEFTERIKIDGAEIGQDAVIDFVSRLKPALERIHPSFFETTVAIAFAYFVSQKVDVAVIEVGLGGRLDSTNVITPVVSLITNISYDHTDLLGNTLPKIAAEKAGIIKPNIPVVIGERQDEVEQVFLDVAEQRHSPITFASDHYHVQVTGPVDGPTYKVDRDNAPLYEHLDCQLKGLYQIKNIAGVLQTIELLRRQNFTISDEAIQMGIGKVVTLTGLKGRWQTIGLRPLIICDTGHNVDGMREVVQQIAATPHNQLHIVLGMVKDKDIGPVLNLLPKGAIYYFCQARIPRALPAEELKTKALDFGLKGQTISDVNEAISKAKSQALQDDLIFIGGSTFVVAEITDL